ncbi:hypothetical protein TTHERM_001028815 (macronuclear) [Tetrahymena thermophila SB210]|uniref:Uncharacterized protein n=1 Tax=Tetrahymena thermophila (strain SB210) TaxID=312017 RepID=W7XK35_TETTS|nr:hypothetical protein TTHERM_001028815 [Tetrahymena thermophila SB210]EWS74564.1 hypothetical protein TTHERM_001028815 [Tetrahymena thermophila SB210]|eukprot:XP_012652896.1 hypothetical protein TTHERM_001028815 [Tetrahymena thermophila SB210]
MNGDITANYIFNLNFTFLKLLIKKKEEIEYLKAKQQKAFNISAIFRINKLKSVKIVNIFWILLHYFKKQSEIQQQFQNSQIYIFTCNNAFQLLPYYVMILKCTIRFQLLYPLLPSDQCIFLQLSYKSYSNSYNSIQLFQSFSQVEYQFKIIQYIFEKYQNLITQITPFKLIFEGLTKVDLRLYKQQLQYVQIMKKIVVLQSIKNHLLIFINHTFQFIQKYIKIQIGYVLKNKNKYCKMFITRYIYTHFQESLIQMIRLFFDSYKAGQAKKQREISIFFV